MNTIYDAHTLATKSAVNRDMVPYLSQASGIGFKHYRGEGWMFGLFTALGFVACGKVGDADTCKAWCLARKRRENTPKIAAAEREAADWRTILAKQ